MKKLYRSTQNKIFAGLLGGLGEYFDVDPVMVRLVFVTLLICTAVFPMTIIYILGLFVVPLPPDSEMIRDAEIVN